MQETRLAKKESIYLPFFISSQIYPSTNFQYFKTTIIYLTRTKNEVLRQMMKAKVKMVVYEVLKAL